MSVRQMFGWCAGLVLFLNGCVPAQMTPVEEITVFAATSLLEPFKEIGAQFEREHTGVKVVFNFAASNQLLQQMVSGAKADVFASANQAQMKAAEQADLVAAGQACQFAANRMVVIVPLENLGRVSRLEDLAKPGLRLVMAARDVPAGQYALDFLEKAAGDAAFGAAFRQAVLGNVVSYELNVKSVVGKVALGEADAGLVYSSDLAGTAGEKLKKIEIPDALNVVASYPIAVTKEAQTARLAQAFVAMVLGQDGQKVLAKFGFMPGAR